MQDRLRENGELVWKLLQEGAHFYVCGDAAHMAGSVEQALLHIIETHQVNQLQLHILSRSVSRYPAVISLLHFAGAH